MTTDQLIAKTEAALARAGEMTFADAVELARARKLQIFARPDAMVLTQVCSFPRTRVLDCIAAAGTLPGIVGLQREIEEYARGEGCAALTAHGKPSWGYFGERYGWAPQSMMFSKSLTGDVL